MAEGKKIKHGVLKNGEAFIHFSADEVCNLSRVEDLFLSIINISVTTVDIVKNLPKLDFEG